MKFSEALSLIQYERKCSLANPSLAGFHVSKGIAEKAESVKVRIKDKTGKIHKPIDAILMYEEINPNTNRPETELIRLGIWKKFEVGDLFITLNNNKKLHLAKIDPTGAYSLRNGFITQDGKEFVVEDD